MATANPFDLLGDDDNEDPSQLLAAQRQKLPTPQPKKPQQAQPAQPAKLPSKPLPPTQAGEFSIHFFASTVHFLVLSAEIPVGFSRNGNENENLDIIVSVV